MRVLHIIDSLGLGGAESVLHNIALHLEQGHYGVATEILTLYEVSHFGRRLQSAGVKVSCVDMCSKYDPRGLERMVRILRSEQPDIVHAHLFPASYFSALASLFCSGPRWIFTEHSAWNHRRQYHLLRTVERLVYDRFKYVIAVSQHVAFELLRWLPEVESKLKIIPNGVLVSDEHQSATSTADRADGRATLLFVGSLRPAKGVDVLLEAIAGLSVRDYELLIVGEGELRDELERHGSRLGLSGTVRFLGARTNVSEIMQAADCLLIPSRWEGLPMVLLEGMAVGLPVIASSCGGIPEVVQDGVTGYLVAPEQPDELRDRISYVLSNLELARSVGKRARCKIEAKYSIGATTRQLIRLYEQALAY